MSVTHWKIWLLLGVMALVTVPGCGGCIEDPAEVEKRLQEERRKELARKKARKPDFEIRQLQTRPCGKRKKRFTEKERRVAEAVFPPYKPGHWTATDLHAKTNNFNFVGELDIEITDQQGEPIPQIATPFYLTTQRQVALPKRQPKDFESIFFAPPIGKSVRASYRLRSKKGSNRQCPPSLLRRMPSYQYHLVVMARLPERYGYLKNLDTVRYSLDSMSIDAARGPYYRITLMSSEGRSMLPSNSLAWTSIACVLWDDAEPDRLDPLQQQSMLDWLHWGGQLIVSGPETLDTLRDSFLSSYLPATASGVRELDRTDLAELQHWSGGSVRALEPARPWTGVELDKHAEAQFLPHTNQLLAERRVGRGRIVVSAFRLCGRELSSWPGFDGLLNACLLRRPARRFKDDNQAGVVVSHLDGSRRGDAADVCKLRYFSRDTGVTFASYGADVRQPAQGDIGTYFPSAVGIDELPAGTGVAAWNDFNPVANAARESLRRAAGIEVPDRGFVVWVVACYLVILVPVNWAVFRMIGRVEWAWAAAPLIAVGCAGLVIKLAQLDIGFARARNEVAVVELQPGYSRAHVTRYTSLYSSLATTFDFQFDNAGGVLLPFPSVTSAQKFYMPSGQTERNLIYRRCKEAAVEGFFVGSNSINFVHSEQMVDLGGTISVEKTAAGGSRVVNNTSLTLHGAGVIKRVRSGGVQTAWIGTLEPGEAAPLKLSLASLGTAISDDRKNKGNSAAMPGKQSWEERWWKDQRQKSSLTAMNPQPGEMNLRQLIDVAQNFTTLEPDQLRLVGWIDRRVSGLTVGPNPPQSQYAGVVVAELAYSFGKDPRPDRNTRSDVEKNDVRNRGKNDEKTLFPLIPKP
ncbi:MAG: hypothetical protein V3V75_03915 [Thermoguttaceae bacterium]